MTFARSWRYAVLLAALMGLLLMVLPAAVDAHGQCGSSRFCGHEDSSWLGGMRVENGDDTTWVDDGFNDKASSASDHESVDVRLYRDINFIGTFWCTKAKRATRT